MRSSCRSRGTLCWQLLLHQELLQQGKQLSLITQLHAACDRV
jgi:hypothetical protein